MSNEAKTAGAARRVLVVEDEKHQRVVLRRVLEGMDFDVTTVPSAEDALVCLDSTRPTVAILDLNLPEMNGLDLAAVLHDRLPSTQMIILTGYGDLQTAQEAIRLDVVDFLLKPCPLDELESAIDRAYRKAVEKAMQRPTPADMARGTGPTPRTIDAVERELVTQALARNAGNRTKAAAELGISVRTLYYRLSRYEAEGRHARPTGAR